MVNKEKNFISAVIYVHNSEMRIEVFLDAVASALEKNFENFEVICVDDASDDGSVGVIKRWGGQCLNYKHGPFPWPGACHGGRGGLVYRGLCI